MTSTNRLILLAARAASIDLAWTLRTSYGDCWMIRGTNEPWNPLVDNGDCWRLQCAMRMGLVYTNTTVQARWYDHTAKAERFGAQQTYTPATLESAARMAIVTAAAAIEEAYEQLECMADRRIHLQRVTPTRQFSVAIVESHQRHHHHHHAWKEQAT